MPYTQATCRQLHGPASMQACQLPPVTHFAASKDAAGCAGAAAAAEDGEGEAASSSACCCCSCSASSNSFFTGASGFFKSGFLRSLPCASVVARTATFLCARVRHDSGVSTSSPSCMTAILVQPMGATPTCLWTDSGWQARPVWRARGHQRQVQVCDRRDTNPRAGPCITCGYAASTHTRAAAQCTGVCDGERHCRALVCGWQWAVKRAHCGLLVCETNVASCVSIETVKEATEFTTEWLSNGAFGLLCQWWQVARNSFAALALPGPGQALVPGNCMKIITTYHRPPLCRGDVHIHTRAPPLVPCTLVLLHSGKTRCLASYTSHQALYCASGHLDTTQALAPRALS